MTFPKGPLVFHGLAIIAGVAGAFLTTPPIEKQPAPPGSIAEEGSIESREPDLLEIARTTQPPDFASVLSQLAPSENPQHASEALRATRLLCRRWIEHNPNEILTYLIQIEFDYQITNRVLREWMSLDPEGAFAAIEKIENPESRKQLIGVAMQEMSQADPERFLEFTDNLPAELESLGFFRDSAIQNLAAKDPEKAIPLLDQLRRDYTRDSAIKSIAGSLADRDPESAIAWIETLESPASRQQALETVLFHMANSDLDAAHRFIEDLGVSAGSNWGGGIYGQVAKHIAETDVLRAVEWIYQHSPNEARERAMGDLIQQIGDTELSLAVLDAMPPSKARDHASVNLFGNWRTGDPKIAWDWIQENLEGDRRKWTLYSFAESIWSSNFDEGWVFAEGLGHSPVEERFRRQLITGLGTYDLDRARELALETGNIDLHNDVVAAAATEMADDSESPEEIVALLAELPADYKFNDPPHFWIATEWVEHDQQAALAWALSLTTGSEAREDSFEGIAYQWTKENPAASREWFAALPPGSDRDAGFRRIAGILTEASDPGGAFSAALEIGENPSRNNALKQAVKAWMKRDPDAAWSAVESSNLDTAAKEQLFRQFRFE